MNNSLIKVQEVIQSTAAISSDNGILIYDAIIQKLSSNVGFVVLDFEGVKLVISAFLNTAVGKLVQDHEIDEVRQIVQFLNIDSSTNQLIDKVLENAKRYYNGPNDFLASLKEVQ